MRKQIKKQIQNSIENLAGTAGRLEELLMSLSQEEGLDLLGQMQTLAIEVGNTIETLESTENSVIHKLESACELLYQISCSVDRTEIWAKMSKELEGIFSDIRSDMEKSISGRLEIVFLPYQVSMWDSLESVWMAANEAPDIDCYVIPIPFYDVQQDNTLGDLHYEGDRYPDYVPVTPYWQYSIEERKPDIIFIHNPYDSYNMVTRIPEKYYASNLRKYTEKLVYIPYFLSEEGGPAEEQCYLPGVLFADKVVVQPGSIYEKYCRVYTNVVEQNGWEKVLLPAKEKFLPLGSPKFDKICSIKCDIEDLPEEWQKVILKKDGSRKKTILYNLSLGPVLESSEQCLEKIDSVFKFFKERREELALLWRPHPLLASTIGSMTPWMKEAYMERVQHFKEEGWGIYDETPDPNLAMAVSDGYYGDSSSLLTVYRETGKPILLQDFYVLD